MNEHCIWHRECDCPPEDTIESLRAEVERLRDERDAVQKDLAEAKSEIERLKADRNRIQPRSTGAHLGLRW